MDQCPVSEDSSFCDEAHLEPNLWVENKVKQLRQNLMLWEYQSPQHDMLGKGWRTQQVSWPSPWGRRMYCVIQLQSTETSPKRRWQAQKGVLSSPLGAEICWLWHKASRVGGPKLGGGNLAMWRDLKALSQIWQPSCLLPLGGGRMH